MLISSSRTDQKNMCCYVTLDYQSYRSRIFYGVQRIYCNKYNKTTRKRTISLYHSGRHRHASVNVPSQ